MAGWRPARCITTLRDEIDRLAPGRDKSSDGVRASPQHTARNPTSDHEPDERGVVHAIDITHDPASGVDTYALAERLRQARDARIKYVISNRRIFAGAAGPSPWVWRPYKGASAHDKHLHLSVVSGPAADDPGPWGVVLSAPSGAPATRRPKLQRGDTGEAVRELQKLLGIAIDGVFGPGTEAAVEALQAARGILVDGIVGPYTWDVLADPLPNRPKMRDIVATVFGGRGDPNQSAYERRQITDDELGVALPWRFPGERPQVRVTHAGRSIVCSILDVGPWNTDDPYWLAEARPQAETGTDRSGRKTNLAGIDLTPAAARAIGLLGKGLVDWEFVGSVAEPAKSPGKPPDPVPLPPPVTGEIISPSETDRIMAEIAAVIRPIVERRMTQETDRLDRIEKVLAQLASAQAAPPNPVALPASAAPKIDLGGLLAKVPWGSLSVLAGGGAVAAGAQGAIPWDTVLSVGAIAASVLGVRFAGPLAALGKVLQVALPAIKVIAANAETLNAAIEKRAADTTPAADPARGHIG